MERAVGAKQPPRLRVWAGAEAAAAANDDGDEPFFFLAAAAMDISGALNWRREREMEMDLGKVRMWGYMKVEMDLVRKNPARARSTTDARACCPRGIRARRRL
jgi:hypothetical protein